MNKIPQEIAYPLHSFILHVIILSNSCFHSMSDDNFLKNLELFDKLCLRFSSRILFVKDILGSTEICCWSFFGHGQKLGEVCCTSIVYGTDKKHTKVCVIVVFSRAFVLKDTKLAILVFFFRKICIQCN